MNINFILLTGTAKELQTSYELKISFIKITIISDKA
jgi:hypothetical protein